MPLRAGLILVLLTLPLTLASSQSVASGGSNRYSAMAIFDAMAKAYPDRVRLGRPLDGPQILVNGSPFAWAEGRLLPYSDQSRWMEFAPQTFYDYPKEAPDVGTWDSERLADAEERLAARNSSSIHRDSSFFDALWGITGRASADAAQRKVRFLGLPVTVHKDIVDALSRVEHRLSESRKVDTSLDQFLKGLNRLEGYNWRAIAGTDSRSNHSYGTAIDVIPKSYGGKNPYWLWVSQGEDGWYRWAWLRRWQPHPGLVAAFEAEGFVWGGKWLLFDTIHFEYRPEILILNGLR